MAGAERARIATHGDSCTSSWQGRRPQALEGGHGLGDSRAPGCCHCTYLHPCQRARRHPAGSFALAAHAVQGPLGRHHRPRRCSHRPEAALGCIIPPVQGLQCQTACLTEHIVGLLTLLHLTTGSQPQRRCMPGSLAPVSATLRLLHVPAPCSELVMLCSMRIHSAATPPARACMSLSRPEQS